MAGVLHEPVAKCKTIVIAIHGLMSSKESSVIKHTCIELARAGIAAYRVDLSGNGDSEGRFEDSVPSKLIEDVETVIDQFRNQYQRVILMGHSLGAILSFSVCASRKVDGIIAISMPAHPERFAERLTAQQREELRSVGFTTWIVKRQIADIPYTLTERFVQEMTAQRPIDAAKQASCPVLLVQGTADHAISMAEAEEVIGALQKKDVLFIGGADHNITNPQHLDALIGGIIAWLRKKV
jgi:alpha-beta hydrolase superfamily lysophospholipase